MSESTIEMLILEGFGKIVGAPNHEKIATILADRAKLLDELNRVKKDFEQQQQTSVEETMVKEQTPPPVTSPTATTTPNTSNRLLEDKLSLLEDEVRILRSTNENLSTQLSELLDSSAEAGSFLNKPVQMTEPDDRKMISVVAKTAVENETAVENDEETALLRLEVAKLDKDNMQLKMEVEKLYDEIGKFEIETKQLKGLKPFQILK